MRRQSRPPRNELIIDNFAGGGGASTGIELALHRSPDVAINHDPVALAMHEANHPLTRHYPTDVFEIDPRVVTRMRPVGLAWFSPDCKHFSKAKGGAPVSKRVRGLAWVVIKWAMLVKPRVIILENVEEFVTWGPLGADLKPDPARRGKTFALWVAKLRRLGYAVEWRELRACDYGSPTIRKRLFVIARCDGRPIVWPKPTHSKGGKEGLLPWRAAAEIIDWSLPCHSIFLTPEQAKQAGVRRPLKPATLRRIAAGVMRYVVNHADPFLVAINHQGGERVYSTHDPMRTVTAARRGEALVAPCIDRQFGTSRGASAMDPIGTIMPDGGGKSALVAAHMSYGQHGGSTSGVDQPLHTITASRKDQNTVVAAFLAQHNTGVVGHDARSPVSTLTSVPTQQQLVTLPLADTVNGSDRSEQVWAFLSQYYGNETDQDVRDPLRTVTTKDRFGLVTGHITDIAMRMLSPRELFAAQGFPATYRVNVTNPVTGKQLNKSEQTRCVGNSVCPQVAAALVAANVPELTANVAPQRRRQMELVV